MCVKCTLVQVPTVATGSPEAGVEWWLWMLGTKLGLFAKGGHALNHQTISSAPWKWVYSLNLIIAGLLIFLLLWSS